MSDRDQTAMIEWLFELADQWAGGYQDICQLHDTHETKEIDTWFGKLEVFAWEQYEWAGEYCSGDDEVSKSLDVNRAWEPFGTHLVEKALQERRTGSDVVLDFGSHIGWYSLLAARNGFPTLAVAADAEHLRVLAINAARRLDDAIIARCLGWLGPDSSVVALPPSGEAHIRLLKADVEGAENHVVRMTAPLFAAGLVDYALLEVSPVFKDHYPETLRQVLGYGYTATVVPVMADQAPQALDADQLDEYLSTVDQIDVWLKREDL